MDTGGLAHMAYNIFPSNSLGVPTVGYASRGKANGLKRLTVASPPKVGPISEDQVDNSSTPSRTSRLNMLAGLRTAPKTPSAPTSAPYGKTQHGLGNMGPSKYAPQNNVGLGNGVPHTAIGSSFPTSTQQLSMNPGQQFYALPDQVMTPPAIQIDEDDQLDPGYVAQLYAAEQCLNQRAQLLQQQLAQLALTQRQLQQQYPQSPITPQLNLYQQQLLNGTAPIPTEVPGQPGVYIVYNPLTAQYTYVVDPAAQLASSPPPPTPSSQASNPFGSDSLSFRAEVTSPVDTLMPHGRRSVSPPKQTPSPPLESVEPLPPQSANAWRPGHRKKGSSLGLSNISVDTPPKSAIQRSSGMPVTPVTGTFGPGQARAGEHALRQPRNPPNFEELVAKPTTKFEGSKNFATRTRRKALSSLVRAGLERRVVRGSGSAGSMTPVSETELTFSVPSDNDSDSVRSGSASLSGEPSPGLPLNMSSNGIIGSERKASKGSMQLSPTSESGDLTFVDEAPAATKLRNKPLLGLVSAAEKRKTGLY